LTNPHSHNKFGFSEIGINDIELSDEGFYFHEVDEIKYYSTWIIVLPYEPLLLQAAVSF
jgi:hypothetical protein